MDQIYAEIAKFLYAISPPNSLKVIMRAELSEEGDVAGFEFDYQNLSGDVNWFIADGVTNEKIHDLLSDLRSQFINQRDGTWSECNFTLDMQTGNFKMDFKYPEKNK